MKKYENPVLDVLLFDEEEDILTASVQPQVATYSADQLNKYMYDNINVSSTTTIKIQDVEISGN